jgi:hypothetical protein
MKDVTVITVGQALKRTQDSLGLPFESDTVFLSRPLIAQSLRRASFIAAPCAAHILRSLVFKALFHFTSDLEALSKSIEETLEDLIALGDLLEMRTEIDGRKDTVLRPAPPAFVARRDDTLIILGVAGDEVTPIVQPPIVHQSSGLRTIRPGDAQSCRRKLLDLGLIELPERLWLFQPSRMSANELVAQWMERLPIDAKPEKVEGLEILLPASVTTFYKGRWAPSSSQISGTYVGRRNRKYGAKLWCFVEIRDGLVLRLIDIRARDSRTRDCDEAWCLQAAMDAVAGTPQVVRVLTSSATTTLAFFAPLPAWAARRLSFIGRPVSTPRALLAFEIPNENTQDELRWLGESLWLACMEKGDAA